MTSLLCLLATAGLVWSEPTLVPVPVRFITTAEYSLNSHEKSVYQANIDCDNLINATVEICAELPGNWQWNPMNGYVFLNVFNNTKDTIDLGKALNGTGRPQSGDASVPSQCTRVEGWPGGSLFIRVDANNYSPVLYTVSAQVSPDSGRQQISLQRWKNSTRPIKEEGGPTREEGGPMREEGVVMLTPVVAPQSRMLEYDHDITFVMDLCLNHYQPSLLMKTSVLSKTGTFTHYVCNAFPCTPDSESVICSANFATPVSTCAAGLSGKPEQVFVTVHAASGALDDKTGTFISNLNFAASLDSLT